MPSTYAHDCFGKAVYKQLPKEIQKEIKAYGPLYMPDRRIQRLLEKKGYTPEMPREQANKIYQFLLRRGYKSSDILYVMRSEYLT